MSRDGFDGESPEPQVSTPFDLDAAPPDELAHDEPSSRRARWATVALALAVLASAAGASVYRSVQREHQRVAYDNLIALSTAGEQAVANAVSQTRDVVQYAEPLLNSAQTTPATRTALLHRVAGAAQRSRAGIEAQRARLATAPAPGKLRLARDATERYLADWAAVFENAGGGGAPLERVQNDLLLEQDAAREALRAAAPDKGRAAQADTALGTLGW